jgi:hypothetical protein
MALWHVGFTVVAPTEMLAAVAVQTQTVYYAARADDSTARLLGRLWCAWHWHWGFTRSPQRCCSVNFVQPLSSKISWLQICWVLGWSAHEVERVQQIELHCW